ncbi:MAG: hypothetical protein GTO45_12910 [Candidatus Aminicenantes bacterium]|nr:hypothetical protein [Candidatus Aminicenantes bacterium]NIM79685.1 hypothetical protein [Candidatus Aminicenantes bacterium]NIN19011.1 hypothetical protein [Candidatus Aminicenantes bacterium]NIN42913.1 hypothetical protein [Candidatus Aminicenantes bacterium]NIN85650.1 hypothetical protein [Candidatus Aminicenantes bacterium]
MIDENWWPEPLEKLSEENPLADDRVVVAEISTPWGSNSFREFNTALVPPDFLASVLESSGCVEHQVSPSGPHPSSYRGNFDYDPWFRIRAGVEGVENGFEPLVVSWKSGENKVWLPDQGFLMTYGLVPRISEEDNLIYWDDPEKPQPNIIICKPVSVYSRGLKSEARVLIDKQYLQDYATVRNCSLVQVYYASNDGYLSAEILEIMGDKQSKDIMLKGRLINLFKNIHADSDDSKLKAQVWGTRHLIAPKDSPVIEGRWEYGELKWPGIKEPITYKLASKTMPWEYVYVRDSVLNKYEEHPESYDIHPEYGSVSYKGQWSVGYCRRVGRDFIQIELKKLYGGPPPDVVRHFHQHAVEPPSKSLHKHFKELNIGTRSKRIVYNLVEVGELLADINNNIMGEILFTSDDFVNLKRSELDYSGWWKNPFVRPITRHIPVEMGKNGFLERCRDLNTLIVEGLSEKNLRKVLIKMNIDNRSIERLRGLKLLDMFNQYGSIVEDTGLEFISNKEEIEKRRLEKVSRSRPGEHLKTPLELLFALNDLRNAASHRKEDVDSLLDKAGIKKASLKAGWGYELDRLYDRLGDSLEDVSRILSALLE